MIDLEHWRPIFEALDEQIDRELERARLILARRRRRFLCPFCDGEGAKWSGCYCDGSGVIDELEADTFRQSVADAVEERTICERKGFESKPVELEPPPLWSGCSGCDGCAFDAFTPAGRLNVERGDPVFCLRAAHVTGWNELVPIYGARADGRPIGYPICGRWKRLRAMILRGRIRRAEEKARAKRRRGEHGG